MRPPPSIPGVLDVELLRGADAPSDVTPDLLIEVPHGADRRSDYDRLRSQLVGDLPEGLEAFFHVNTDVAAWDYGRATAAALVAEDPTRTALLLRCLLPRTFVDCNRPADYAGGDLTEGALTAGIPSYVEDDRDRALLLELHRSYLTPVDEAYAWVCGAGGLAMAPHTYAPRSVGIERVDREIVQQLAWAYEPERFQTWPERVEVDLLTRDGDGVCYAPPGIEEALLAAFPRVGLTAHANVTYHLVPGSQAATWSTRHPGHVLCLELRRDLLVEAWRPFEPMTADPAKVAPVAQVLARALLDALREKTR